MKVDLAALRALIEEEIERVEQKKVRLQQKLQNITAVEEIAKEADSSSHLVEQPEKPVSNDPELAEHSRRWFQQV